MCCSQQLTIPAYFTLHQCGPSLIIALDHRAPSCAVWCAIGPYQKHRLHHQKLSSLTQIEENKNTKDFY